MSVPAGTSSNVIVATSGPVWKTDASTRTTRVALGRRHPGRGLQQPHPAQTVSSARAGIISTHWSGLGRNLMLK